MSEEVHLLDQDSRSQRRLTRGYPDSAMVSKIPSRRERLQEILFVLAIVTLPFSAQGLRVFGLQFEASYLFVLVFSMVRFWDTPPRDLDRWDLLYIVFLLTSAISLAFNLALGRVLPSDLSVSDYLGLRGGLRFSLRPLVHFGRFVIFYLIYKSFKEFLSAGNWLRRQRLLFRGFVFAGSIVAIYGSYQFFASRLELPFGNINNLHAVGVYLTPHYLSLDRPFYTIMATFGEPKTYGVFLLGLVPFLVAIRALVRDPAEAPLGLSSLQLSPRWLALLVLVLLAHFGLGFSRTSFVALSLLVVFIFFFVSRSASILYFCIFVIFWACFALLRGKPPFSLLLEFWYSLLDPMDTGGYLTSVLEAGLDLWKRSPWLGYALGNVFSQGVVVHHGRISFVLNDTPTLPMYLLTSTGILGFCVFFVFLIGQFRLHWSRLRGLGLSGNERSFVAGALVALAGVWIGQCVHNHANALLCWIILAESAALTRILKDSAISEEVASSPGAQ